MSRNSQSSDDLTFDDLYDERRRKVYRDTDALAVQASLRDIEEGERGQSVAEFFAEFDVQRKASTSD